MNLHEYQGKSILKSFGVAIQEGKVVDKLENAIAAAKELSAETGTEWYVVKAQIHAGGRGLGGGVKVAKGIAEVRKYAKQILGMNLITHQTGPEGKEVKRLLVEQGVNIEKEFYV